MVAKREIVWAIVFSVLTCGIYSLYWMACINDDANILTEDYNAPNGILVVIFTILTCGIYGFFWAYKMGEKIDTIKRNNGEFAANNTSLLFLILQIFGFGIVNLAIAQDTFNKIDHTTYTTA